MALQAVTPELRRWIVEQAQAGHEAQAVLSAMLSSGWNEDVAIAAIESTMEEHLRSVQPALPPAAAVPEPMAGGPANKLDAGDRQVSVLLAMEQPRLLVLADLLSAEECHALIEDARARLTRSLTVVVKDGSDEPNVDRTSHGMFFDRGETPLVQRIETRIANLLGWPVENGEGLQVLQYLPGAEYKPHYDYF